MADVPVIVAVITGAAGVLGSAVATVASNLRSVRAETLERDRLTNEVFGGRAWLSQLTPQDMVALEQASPGSISRILENAGLVGESPATGDLTAPEEPNTAAELRIGLNPVTESENTYDKLLINDYALGLTQARRAFNVSTMFSILGGIVLVAGVALAIFRAETGGQVAGAIITSSAGVLTTGLSQLFREQSTKALKHMEAQAAELRKDVRAQSDAANALRLLGQVTDENLRVRLQAALILQFSGATLPDLSVHLMPHSDSNGSGIKNHEDAPIALNDPK